MKRLSAIALSLLIIAFSVCAFITPASAADADKYGYSQLTNDRQKAAYAALEEGVGLAKASISFTISIDNPDSIGPDIQFALDMVQKDHPEYFWFDGTGSLSVNNNLAQFIPAAYRVNGQVVTEGSAALTNAQNQLNQVVNAALSQIPASASNYDKALILHDFVAGKVTYKQVGDHQTAYGALVANQAVCAGYAKAYQLLLNKAGIRCTYISGKSYDPNGSLVNHAWNLLWLDGKCVYTDVTWDDQGENLFHEYFNISKAEIGDTHFTNESLPASCGHEDMTYFRKTTGAGICDMRTDMTAQQIAPYFKLTQQGSGTATYVCTVHYHGANFANWLQSQYVELGKALGFNGFNCNYSELGKEHQITFSGNHSGQPTTGTTPQNTQPASQPTPQPTQSTQATQPRPTTPNNNQQPTQATQSTQSSNPAQATQPSAGQTQPSESQGAVQPTQTTTPGGTTNPIESTASGVQTDATQGQAPSGNPDESMEQTQGATKQTQASGGSVSHDEKETPPVILFVVIGVAVVGAGGFAAVYFIKKRKA